LRRRPPGGKVCRTQAKSGFMSQSQAHARQEFREIAVFTGDLVGSSRLSPDDLARAMREVELASYDIRRKWSHHHPRFTHYQRETARGSAGPSSG
jgi:hypothetical protein